jgi:hypothetical protein
MRDDLIAEADGYVEDMWCGYELVAELSAAFKEAQERIAALEGALLELSEGWDCCGVSKAMREIARAALAKGEKT